MFQAQIQSFMLAKVKVAEHSPASKEQHRLHQGLQCPEGTGCSGAAMYFYYFPSSEWEQGTPGFGW